MPDCLLITGATGFVGRSLIARLKAADPGRHIVALVRDPVRAATLLEPDLELIPGDVTLPQLGLDSENSERLAAYTTQIIHAAADVTFGASLAKLRVANVSGTQNLLLFAGQCPRLKRFAHLSTISIHGLRAGALQEAPSPAGQNFVNAYQQSKHEAEWCVLNAMNFLPAEIFRLSIVAADSVAGRVSQFNYSHHVTRFLPNSILPVIPGDPDAYIDLVTLDWTVDALAYMFDNKFTPGAVRNLCAGSDSCLTLHEAMDILIGVFTKYSDRPARLPKFVTPAEFDQTIDGCGDVRLKKAAAILGPHIKLLGVRQSFCNERTKADLCGTGIDVPPLREWFGNMIEYCMQTDWGKQHQRWSMIDPGATDPHTTDPHTDDLTSHSSVPLI